MSNRVMQVGLASFFATALGASVAHAQDEAPAADAAATDEASADPAATAPDADGDGMPDSTDAAPADDGLGGDAAADSHAGHVMPANGVVRAGGIAVNVVLGIGLAKENAGDPITLSPDVWYGVSDKLAVGLTHSGMALTGFWSNVGMVYQPSLCVSGDSCADEIYRAGGLQAAFGLSQSGDLSLAAVGGLIYDIVDPFRIGLRAGVDGKWHSGKIAVMFTPSIYIGLNERDFNKEALNIPVAVAYAVSPQLHLGAQTGVRGPLDGFGDSYSVPLGLGAHFMVNGQIAVGGAFTLERVAGFELPEGASAMDARSLMGFVNWRN